MVSCSHNIVRSSLMKQRWKNTSCWTRQMLQKQKCHSFMRTASSRVTVVSCLCINNLQTSSTEAVRLLKVFLTTPTTQQLNMRGAFLLCKGSKLCWESPWHRIVLMLWLCSPWRRNSTETFKNKVNKRFSTQTERRTKFLHNTNVFLGHYLKFLVAVYHVLLLFQVFISLNTLYIDI